MQLYYQIGNTPIIPTDVTGDYLAINGKRYTVCDPTYINAPVEATMPGMDNQKAKVILLE